MPADFDDSQHDALEQSARQNLIGLGERLAQSRAAANLTLIDLAQRSGVSPATLSQIERGRANPTLTILHRIAAALEIPLAELVEDPTNAQVFEVLRGGRDWRTTQDCEGKLLSPRSTDLDTELYRFTLPPGGRLESAAHAPLTREILTVVRGTVRVASGKRHSELKAGDVAHYSADLPHAISNVGHDEALVYMVARYRTATPGGGA